MSAPRIVVVKVGPDWVTMRELGDYVEAFPTWADAVRDARRLEKLYDEVAIVAGDADSVRLAEKLLRERVARISDMGPEVDLDGEAC